MRRFHLCFLVCLFGYSLASAFADTLAPGRDSTEISLPARTRSSSPIIAAAPTTNLEDSAPGAGHFDRAEAVLKEVGSHACEQYCSDSPLRPHLESVANQVPRCRFCLAIFGSVPAEPQLEAEEAIRLCWRKAEFGTGRRHFFSLEDADS